MRRFALAGLAALAIAGSTAVYAHQGLLSTNLKQMRMHLTAQDRADLVDARIAAVHAGLKLTPDQEKLWPPIASAVRDFAKARIDRRAARIEARQQAEDQAAQTPPDPIARLRKRADNMATTAAALKKIADAAEPLYKTLDDGQKRRLAILTRHHGRLGGPHPAWRHHWMERHDGGHGAPDDGGPARL